MVDSITIEEDIAAVGRLESVPAVLRIICQSTGMGFSAIARVTENRWVACSVRDEIQFGLAPGGELDINTTLCKEVREARSPIAFDHASCDIVYQNHHTPKLYKIESYISVPIILENGEYFGNLCAIDPRPAKVANDRVFGMFTQFAELIARLLENERQHGQNQLITDELRVNEKLREQFIAVLGHDLRSPLMAVLMSSDILAQSSEVRVSKLGHLIMASARRMSDIIDETMDFSRGRLGLGIKPNWLPVSDLESKLRSVIEEQRAANPDCSIVDEIDELPLIECDVGRLQQVLSNLVSNALTHGDRSRSIRVSAQVNNRRLTIGVFNEGTVISADDLKKVLDPYWRGRSPKPSGLGLGLYISSQVMLAHGGEINVTSNAVEGTCFMATMPLGANPTPAPH